MILFIIGYMACGKTTFGKALAQLTSTPFIDLDEEIEKSFGKTITEIFNTEGEQVFRQIENKIISTVDTSKPLIIACGGGTPCFNNNMEIINKKGVSLWLQTPVPVIIRRLLEEKGKRPLVEKIGEENLLSYVDSHLQKRIPFYSKAKITFDGTLLENEDEINASVKKFLATYPELEFAITKPLH